MSLWLGTPGPSKSNSKYKSDFNNFLHMGRLRQKQPITGEIFKILVGWDEKFSACSKISWS